MEQTTCSGIVLWDNSISAVTLLRCIRWFSYLPWKLSEQRRLFAAKHNPHQASEGYRERALCLSALYFIQNRRNLWKEGRVLAVIVMVVWGGCQWRIGLSTCDWLCLCFFSGCDASQQKGCWGGWGGGSIPSWVSSPICPVYCTSVDSAQNQMSSVCREVSENSVLLNLKKRFQRDCIYVSKTTSTTLSNIFYQRSFWNLESTCLADDNGTKVIWWKSKTKYKHFNTT